MQVFKTETDYFIKEIKKKKNNIRRRSFISENTNYFKFPSLAATGALVPLCSELLWFLI